MQVLIRQQTFTGAKYHGRVFDCGSKIGCLAANVVFALDRPDIADPFRAELKAFGLSCPILGRGNGDA